MSFFNSITPFFSSDDWFHLRISSIHSLQEFLNFFSFSDTAQSASFYRPLSTQVFFYIFHKLFDLNALPYYLFGIILFSLILFLLYKFTNSIVTTLIYAVSVTNFTRLFFLSSYQELFLVFFSLLTLIFFKNKKYLLSLPCFILALLSKETAVILPILLFVLSLYEKKVSFRKLSPYFFVLAIYLYLRLFIFKGVSGDSYLWDFSPLKAANTLFWYTLWSFGAPELLVDYVGSGLRLLPRFFTDYPIWSYIILSQLGLTLLAFVALLLKNFRRTFFGMSIFVISLLSVLFLPWHKFTLELGLPLVGFSIMLSTLIGKTRLGKVFLFLFVIFNLSMWPLTYSRNYAVSRGVISQKIINYLHKNYPTPPQGYFEFINDTPDYGVDWGSSKQISNAIGSSELFRVFYTDPGYTVFFEDSPSYRPNLPKIPLSTKYFVSNTIDK